MNDDPDRPKVTIEALPAAEKDEPSATARPAPEPPDPERAAVRVAPDLLPMITGLATTAEEQAAAREQRDLNELVHRVLIVGLVASTALMLVGLALDLILRRDVPTTTIGLAEALRRAADLRPSGFLTLGMVVLIATPILRVIGSIFAFAYQRDWRYTAVTIAVLAIVLLSLLSGRA